MLAPSEKKAVGPDDPCPEEGIGAMKAVDIDAFRLADMGYAQDMTRNFSTLSILGISFTLTSSWFGFSVSLVTGLSSGGTVVSVWGIPLLALISGAVAVTLSELASSMPNAGGQYFWTTQLAPKKYANGLAFLCGWVSWVAAIFTTASSALGLGNLLVGIWQLTHPDFVPQAWHSVVGYLVVNLFCSLFNCVGQLLPTVATVSMYISLVSFIVVFITVPAASDSFSDPKFVFATFTNSTGWPSDGLAFLLGLINPNWLFVCLDAATHMAEEVKCPERIIPKAIMSTVAVGAVTSWVFCLAMFFCITDLNALLNTSTGVPILELFYQSLESKTGASVLGALIVATGIGCQIASQTWQSRLCWSFARDGGLPGYTYLGKVHPTLQVPLNAHIVSTFFVSLLSILYLGSSEAFNSLVTACIVLLYVSYSIPVVCLLVKGRRNLVRGWFWMEKIGLISNWILLAWTAITLVVYSFPAAYPVTPSSMNFVAAAYGGVAIVITADWLVRGRYVHRRILVEEPLGH